VFLDHIWSRKKLVERLGNDGQEWSMKVECKEAKLQAGIKPTAFCSVFDKENSMEFQLDFLYYLYNYYMVCALLSYVYHVIYYCDIM